MRPFFMCVASLIALTGCGWEEYDPRTDVHTGAEAKRRILEQTGEFPASASNFFIFDGGNFNGSIVYWSLDCSSREDCWQVVTAHGGLGPEEFQPFDESKYAVVMVGPSFYWTRLRDTPWDVRAIENGICHERVNLDRGRLVYYAIDFDRNRVFYHKESGGFPTDENSSAE